GFVDVEDQGRDGDGIRVLSAGTAAGTRRGPPLPAGLLRGQVLAPHSRQVESLVLLRVLLRGIHCHVVSFVTLSAARRSRSLTWSLSVRQNVSTPAGPPLFPSRPRTGSCADQPACAPDRVSRPPMSLTLPSSGTRKVSTCMVFVVT